MGRKAKEWAPKPSNAARAVVRVAGYVRVSTADQAQDGFGLTAQREAIAAYCLATGHELVDVFADEGISGAVGPDQRPGLAAALASVEAGAVDAIVVKALDRIGRSLAVSAAVFGRLDAAGASFLSITEPALSSDLLRGLFSGIAADERRRILERTSSGRIVKAEAGGFAGGAPPYGYRLVGSRKTARLEIDPTEAAIVKHIFARRTAGASLQAIADELTGRLVPTPRGGQKWHSGTVSLILRNPSYGGQQRWREGREIMVDQAHPAIVDPSFFVQSAA